MSSDVAFQARRGRPDAAMMIWRWRAEERAEAPGAGAGAVRRRGVLQSAFGGAVAVAVYHFVSSTAGLVIGGIATTIALCALISPLGLFARIDAVFQRIGHGIGVAVTWITMGLLFFGFFLPFGRIFRRGRRDGMKRFYEPDAESYWTLREASEPGADSYRRPF